MLLGLRQVGQECGLKAGELRGIVGNDTPLLQVFGGGKCFWLNLLNLSKICVSAPLLMNSPNAVRRIVLGLLVLIAGAATALTSGCSRNAGQGEGGGWPVTQVALAPVECVRVPRALYGAGELEATRQVQLAAEVSGRITELAFSSGQQVQEGQLLVQLNDGPEQAERARLVAQLRNAEAMLARAEALQADKAASQEQYDTALVARDMARGELQRIEAVIAQKSIRAPFSGVIGIRRVHQGQYLNAGEPIASLVDASELNVNFPLPEQAIARLRTGQAVQVQVDAWPDERFEGEVVAIDPMINATRNVWVQAQAANNQGRLKAGMFANVRVLMPEEEPVLAVPETAVTYTAYGQTVFVAEPDAERALRVRRVAVTTAQRWDGKVEIKSGLREGQQVVVSGQIKLSDGMLVTRAATDSLKESL